eukprot:GHVQ01006904.1.p1 GENE.GHVQ01006904.1~~GHVQ01006904.1.p1  ORF type:complete len:390 (+),score=108.83 GHVQ01006904.1:154-1170(+)
MTESYIHTAVNSTSTAVTTTTIGGSELSYNTTITAAKLYTTIASTTQTQSSHKGLATTSNPIPHAKILQPSLAGTPIHPSPTALTGTTIHPSPAVPTNTTIHPSPAAPTNTTIHPSPAALTNTTIHPAPAAATNTTIHASPTAPTNTTIHLSAAAPTSTTVHPSHDALATTSIHPSLAAPTNTTVHPSPAAPQITTIHLPSAVSLFGSSPLLCNSPPSSPSSCSLLSSFSSSYSSLSSFSASSSSNDHYLSDSSAHMTGLCHHHHLSSSHPIPCSKTTSPDTTHCLREVLHGISSHSSGGVAIMEEEGAERERQGLVWREEHAAMGTASPISDTESSA